MSSVITCNVITELLHWAAKMNLGVKKAAKDELAQLAKLEAGSFAVNGRCFKHGILPLFLKKHETPVHEKHC